MQNCSLDKLEICRYRYLQRAGEICCKLAPVLADECALTGQHAEEDEEDHDGGESIILLIFAIFLCFLDRNLIGGEPKGENQ